ncbi:MAG TPA: HD domain-containing phosphohydrolase, partial [Thermoleophilaceae bacterium]
GAVLGRDVMDGRPSSIPLLRKGVNITARHREALLAAGVHAVYVDDAISEGIEVKQAVDPDTRRKATIAVSRAFDGCRESLSNGTGVPEALVSDLQKVAEMIARDIEENADMAVALDDLASADGYTLQHSIDVAAIGMLVGQRLFREKGWIDHTGRRTYERRDRRLARLGLGLLLHDIGKLIIPQDVLNKPSKLDPAEWELMKAHPRAGVEMLRSDLISPLVKVVVRSHHERWDGGGYPDALAGEEIHQLARVAAAADVYDAVTSERVYASARPPDIGVQIVLDGSGRAFDPDVVDVFRRVVTPFPPGVEVELGDGRRGVVVSVPQDDLTRPVVRVGWEAGGRTVSPYELDTADAPELSLACVTAKGTTSREEDPPPLPTRPEPTPTEIVDAREAREARQATRRVSRRAGAWR